MQTEFDENNSKYPLCGIVNSRTPPRAPNGKTFSDVVMNPEEKAEFVEWIETQYNAAMYELAKDNPAWLSRKRVYVMRDCKIHGKFLYRADNRSRCMRCTNTENAEGEDITKDKERKYRTNLTVTSDHPYIAQHLADQSGDEEDSFSDLKDFIVV